jgi:hypothetical protein
LRTPASHLPPFQARADGYARVTELAARGNGRWAAASESNCHIDDPAAGGGFLFGRVALGYASPSANVDAVVERSDSPGDVPLTFNVTGYLVDLR